MLRKTAELVRTKLETISYVGEYATMPIFEQFPRGCCKAAALLYLYYLRECRGIETQLLFLIANAQITEDTSHAWAKVGPFHVDITGDQFGADKVVVSDHHPWPNIHRRGAEYPFIGIIGEQYEMKLAKVCEYVNQGE